MSDFKIEGLDELKEDIEKVVKISSDIAYDTVHDAAKEFKKQLSKNVKKGVKTSKNITKGFKVTKPTGSKMNLESNFMAEGKGGNAHFHLIENGHDIVMPYRRNNKTRKDGGDRKGFVPGKKFVPKTLKEFEPTYVEKMEEMIERVLEKGEL